MKRVTTLLAILLISILTSLMTSCNRIDETSYWVKCEMGFVGVEDSLITISMTTPEGVRGYDLDSGWYSEEFGPFAKGDTISMKAEKEGDGYFVYKIYVSQDGSKYEVKAEKTCETYDEDNSLQLVL